jgi:hypothetical protein
MDNIYEQEGLSEEESDGGDFDNGGGIKYTYRDDTWKQVHFTSRGGHSMYKPSDTCVNGVILRGVLFWESCFLVPYYYVIL